MVNVRLRPLRFLELALVCGWVILGLAGVSVIAYAVAVDGVQAILVLVILVAVCGWMLAVGLRDLPAAWADVGRASSSDLTACTSTVAASSATPGMRSPASQPATVRLIRGSAQ